MRNPQSPGLKGSQKWIQILINESPHLLDKQIHSVLKIKSESIKWVSPLKEDEFAEYRDDDFLKILGLHHHNDDLRNFWPKGGPQWDGLGKSNDKIFLVEAKANIPELISSSQAKSKTSIIQIENSLSKTQDYLNCKPIIDWRSGFYQYANRIAHLFFLRNICNIDAYMIFIYFLNDDSHISTLKDEWITAIQLQKLLLGLSKNKLQRYTADIFVDIKTLLI